MYWFFIASFGYLLLAIVSVLDKFILDKSVPKPALYTFFSTIFMFGALLGYPFIESLSWFHWGIAVLSGSAFGFGMWAMYISLVHGEASHIAPFIGAIVSVSTFIGGGIFLKEILSSYQILGIFVLITASLLLSFEKTETSEGMHRGFLWAALSGVLFAVSHVSAKYIYTDYSFITGLVTTKATIGIVGLIALCVPSVWKSVITPSPKSHKKQAAAVRFAAPIVIADKVLGVLGVILIQYAISLGSVTVVNAMSGLQYVCVFLLIYAFSMYSPRIFKEYFTRKEILIEVAALVLVVLGSALLVITA